MKWVAGNNYMNMNPPNVVRKSSLPLPFGVISETSSSMVTFSRPFLRITSLQNSFRSSRHPHWISLSRSISFSLWRQKQSRLCYKSHITWWCALLDLSFSPVSTSFAMMVSLICSSLFFLSSWVLQQNIFMFMLEQTKSVTKIAHTSYSAIFLLKGINRRRVRREKSILN